MIKGKGGGGKRVGVYFENENKGNWGKKGKVKESIAYSRKDKIHREIIQLVSLADHSHNTPRETEYTIYIIQYKQHTQLEWQVNNIFISVRSSKINKTFIVLIVII